MLLIHNRAADTYSILGLTQQELRDLGINDDMIFRARLASMPADEVRYDGHYKLNGARMSYVDAVAQLTDSGLTTAQARAILATEKLIYQLSPRKNK